MHLDSLPDEPIQNDDSKHHPPAIHPCTISCHAYVQGPHTDAPDPTNLSLPATLALQALAALLATNASNHGSNPGGNFVPDLKRLRTRVVVGPEPGKSCVVPGAAMVEVAPWEKDAVQDVFVQRHCTREACSGEEDG